MNNWDLLYLPIPYEFQPLFDRMTNACQFLLERQDLSPQDHSLLAKLKYALNRLPIITVDVDVVAILWKDRNSYTNNAFPHDLYTLELNNSFLRATNSSHQKSSEGNPETTIQQTFYCNNHGYFHQADVDGLVNLTIFMNWIKGWETLCQDPYTRFTIHDFDEKFNWAQFHDHSAWEKMPSLLSNSILP